MEQARNYVCKQCASPVPSGHKFCGACGGGVPAEAQSLATQYYGAMQAPGKARLIVVRGDRGVGEGLSYLLQASEHVAGREADQIPFPGDMWLSPRHANFLYRGDRLVVRDEGSLNGVYLRIRAPQTLQFGDYIICGNQVFRIDQSPPDSSGPDAEDTYFYGSPQRPSAFQVTQILDGGMEGLTIGARENTVLIGRENGDMNFPEDVNLSALHARIELQGDQLRVVDEGSQNGVYVRIRGEQELAHGDYLWMGRQLLRVEVTT